MIGVDFGGTRIKIVKVDGGEILASHSVGTDPSGGHAGILRDIAEGVRALDPQPASVGFAIPGEVDDEGRVWRFPNLPGFEGVAIGEELAELLGCPVCVENDGIAAALAEARFGHGRQHQSFVILLLGTGIGGGVVLDGRPWRGRHGFGGELGHVTAYRSEDAQPCGCGDSGCVEAYAGTAALHRKFEALGGQASEVVEIAESARRGEKAGLAAFEMMGRALGHGIRSMQNVLDLDAVVFAGGISASFDLIEDTVRATLREHPFAPPLGEVPLLVSELGANAGALGAAHLSSEA